MRDTRVAGDPGIDADERRSRDGGYRGAPRGARQLSAILPNGRTVWLRVAAPVAQASSLRELARDAEYSADRRRPESAALVDAIARLSKTLDEDVERLQYARVRGARRFRRRILAGDIKVDRRLSKAREEFRARLEKQLQIDRENVRRLRRRDRWDKILIASALPLFAAYGQRNSPFSANNLTLTLSLLIFLAGDHVVEAVLGTGSPKKPYALDDADAWSYLAPAGNLLAGWWLLGDRQHHRFVTGVTTVKLHTRQPQLGAGPLSYRFRERVELRERIAKDHFPDFVTFADVPVVATVRAVRLTPAVEASGINLQIEALRAKVDDGVLKLSFRARPPVPAPSVPSSLGEVEIAWMVDTDEPLPPESR